MMNEMQVFRNSEFGELGVIEVEGKVYFPATACAKKLGYKNPQEAIRTHCKGVSEILTPTKGGNQSIKIIPEGDLYRLIVSSKLPSAEKFERWVFDEVLPSIRQRGGYMVDGGAMAKQMAEVMAITIASAMAPVVDILARLEKLERSENDIKTPIIERVLVDNSKQPLKIEGFPEHFKEELDDLFLEMKEMERVNYSAISRYCYAKGYPVSNVSLKRYFDRFYK